MIIEGLFALYWQEIRNLLNLCVFVEASNEACLHRRRLRDVEEREFTVDYINMQYEMTVYPMYLKYIQLTKKYANLIINGESNIELSVKSILETTIKHRSLK